MCLVMPGSRLLLVRPDCLTPCLRTGLAALTAYASSTLASEASSEHTDASVARDASAGAQPKDTAESGGDGDAAARMEGATGPSVPSDAQLADAGNTADDGGDSHARVSAASRREDSPAETAPSAAGQKDGSPDGTVPPGLEELERTVETEASGQGAQLGASAARAELQADAAEPEGMAGDGATLEPTGQRSALSAHSTGAKVAGHMRTGKRTATVVSSTPLPVFAPPPQPVAMRPLVWPAIVTTAVVRPPPVPVQGVTMLVPPPAVRPAAHAAAATAETLAIMDKLIQYVKVRLRKPMHTHGRRVWNHAKVYCVKPQRSRL